jgi:hypothetical protein
VRQLRHLSTLGGTKTIDGVVDSLSQQLIGEHVGRASSGGSGGARGVGLQDLVFAWAASYLVAEAPLPGLSLPGRVVQIGAQTGLDVDDVAVLTDQSAFALFQAKAGLKLGKAEDSPLAEAVRQLVTQYLTGPPARSAPTTTSWCSLPMPPRLRRSRCTCGRQWSGPDASQLVRPSCTISTLTSARL